METMKKMRDIEIDTDIKIEDVQLAFVLITQFQYQLTKEDIERVENLESAWIALQNKAMKTQILLLEVQEHFQRELIKNLVLFEEVVPKRVNLCNNLIAIGMQQVRGGLQQERTNAGRAHPSPSIRYPSYVPGSMIFGFNNLADFHEAHVTNFRTHLMLSGRSTHHTVWVKSCLGWSTRSRYCHHQQQYDHHH